MICRTVMIPMLLLVLLLGIRFFFFFQNGIIYHSGQKVILDITLLTQPSQDGRFQKFTVRLSHGERVFITTKLSPSYSYGQTLRIQGILEEKDLGKSSIYTMYFPSIRIIPSQNPLVHVISPIRARIIQVFHQSLGQPESSLLVGIVFGISESMPKDFQKALAAAGVTHVIAASGMNVTLIAAFLTSIVGKFLARKQAIGITIIAIIVYAALAGFSASIVRASVLGIFVFCSQLLGRQTIALYGLSFAGFFMLFVSPFLLFDTGFQLSFVATWGLMVFSPQIQSWAKSKQKLGEWIAQTDLSTTIIAQVVTLPILLSTFGTYSLASIFANLLVLWMIPLLMILGAIGAGIGLLFPLLGGWIMYLCLPFLLFFEQVVWFFGSLPFGFHVDGLPWEITVGYYLIIIALYLIIVEITKKKRVEK